MPITGRPREFDREAAVDAAMRLFWRKGYPAVSLNDLCDAMDIRSPSLYAAFGSKGGLYLEAIEHYVTKMGPALWGKLSSAATARAGVRNLLTAAGQSLPGSRDYPTGCMIVFAAVGDEWPEALADKGKKLRATFFESFRTRLERAVDEGELPATADIEGLARFYVGVFQGMAMQARDGAKTEELARIAETAMTAWPAEPRRRPSPAKRPRSKT